VGWIIAVGYPILCWNFHCGTSRCPEVTGSDTTITEIVIPADTGKVMGLTGLDVVPEEEVVPNEVVFTPVIPKVGDSASLSDQLDVFKETLVECNRLLEDCDLRLRLATATRVYRDTASNDSVDVFIEAVVHGKMVNWSASHNWKIPMVEKKVIVTNVIKDGPYRKIGLGIGSGAQLKTPGNSMSGLPVDGSLSYMDLKNNLFQIQGSYIVNTSIEPNNWAIRLHYSKLFDLR